MEEFDKYKSDLNANRQFKIILANKSSEHKILLRQGFFGSAFRKGETTLIHGHDN